MIIISMILMLNLLDLIVLKFSLIIHTIVYKTYLPYTYQVKQLMINNFLNLFYMKWLKNVLNDWVVDPVMLMNSVDFVLDHRLMMQDNMLMMLMDDFIQINNDNQLNVVVVDHYYLYHLMMKNIHAR